MKKQISTPLKGVNIAITLALFTPGIVSAAESFDLSLLNTKDGSPQVGNIDSIINNRPQAGKWLIRTYVNSESQPVMREVTFVEQDKNITPCFTRQEYVRFGVDATASGVHLPKDDACHAVTKTVDGAQFDYDQAHLSLKLTFPQSVMKQQAADEIPTELWEEGIPAILAQYQYNASNTMQSNNGGKNGTENYLNLKSGMNYGPWRLRNYSTLNQNKDANSQWNNLSTVVERALPQIRSTLTMGDTYTSSDTFDNLELKGVRLGSDDQMLPRSQNGFAPVIRGIAKSNAKVTVRDHGNVVYQTWVTPGPFTLNDIMPVSSGGTLDVTITESDGSETTFQQSYSTLSNLRRLGQFKYELAAGRFSNENSSVTGASSEEHSVSDWVHYAQVTQFNFAWGIPWNMTVMGGLQYSDKDYIAQNLGLGADLGKAGAISSDVTFAQGTEHSHSQSFDGASVRLAWSNRLQFSNTTLNMTSRSYFHDFYNLSDALAISSNVNPKKQEFSFSLTQPIVNSQSLYANINRTLYRDDSVSQNYQLGYSTSVQRVSVSLMGSMTKSDSDSSNKWDKQISLNFSVPLNNLFSHSVTLSTMISNDLRGNTRTQTGINGQALENRALNYYGQVGLQHVHNNDVGQSGSMNLSYNGRAGVAKGGYSDDGYQRRFTWGANGGVVLHQNGLTFSPYSDGAIVLVKAPGAANVPLNTGINNSTDFRGYAVIPDVMPYARNNVQFTANKLGEDVTMDSISTSVIPTRDAVVVAQFNTHTGRKFIARITHNGEPLPFGTVASINENSGYFLVGDDGVAYFYGAPVEGVITAMYSEGKRCVVPYRLSEKRNKQPASLELKCQ